MQIAEGASEMKGEKEGRCNYGLFEVDGTSDGNTVVNGKNGIRVAEKKIVGTLVGKYDQL